jgi:hypothetical protein
MTAKSLIRISGVAFAVGGAAVAVFWALALGLGSFVGADVVRNSLWGPAQWLHVAGAMLAVLGLVGLYAAAWERMGRLGLAGFALALAGTVCFFTDGVIALAVFPALAASAPQTLALSGAMNTAPTFVAFVAFSAIFMTGYLVLGAALLRARIFAAAPVVVLMAGAVLANLPPGPVPSVVIAVGGIFWGAAAAWLGYRLASRSRRSAARIALRRETAS